MNKLNKIYLRAFLTSLLKAQTQQTIPCFEACCHYIQETHHFLDYLQQIYIQMYSHFFHQFLQRNKKFPTVFYNQIFNHCFATLYAFAISSFSSSNLKLKLVYSWFYPFSKINLNYLFFSWRFKKFYSIFDYILCLKK